MSRILQVGCWAEEGKKKKKQYLGQRVPGINRLSGQRIGGSIIAATSDPPANYTIGKLDRLGHPLNEGAEGKRQHEHGGVLV